jgi:hypothetical protein
LSEKSVVEFVFLQCLGKGRVVVRGNRIHRGEDHRLYVLEPGQRGRCGIRLQGNGVSDPRVAHGLDARDQVADLAGKECLPRLTVQAKQAHLFDPVGAFVRHESDHIPGPYRAVKDPAAHDGAPEGVVVGVKDEPGHGRIRVAGGGRNLNRHRIEDLLDPGPLLGGTEQSLIGVETQLDLDLLLHALHVRCKKIDLVDDRNDRQVVLQGSVQVGNRLGLHALRGIDQEEHALTGGEGPGNLVGEVHMARCIDQVELEGLSLVVRIRQAHRLALDRDAPFPLDVHRVEDLVAELPVFHQSDVLDQTVEFIVAFLLRLCPGRFDHARVTRYVRREAYSVHFYIDDRRLPIGHCPFDGRHDLLRIRNMFTMSVPHGGHLFIGPHVVEFHIAVALLLDLIGPDVLLREPDHAPGRVI